MSQPFNRAARVPAAREPDASIGEFWVDNPWQIMNQGENLSAFDRMYLNLGGGAFVDVSGPSAADSDGDGRAAVAADFDRDGRRDLLVRQAGGGTLILYMNNFPVPAARDHWLAVSLRGAPGFRQSNSLGVGARVEASVGGRRLVRDLYPLNTHSSQAPAEVHFGLGAATRVDRLVVRWPSGARTELHDVPGDRRMVIRETPVKRPPAGKAL